MLIPVILSGGAGTRLWPVSREAHPKPFILLPDGQSLMQKTLLRAAALKPDCILTITNRDYFFITRDAYADVALAPGITLDYLLEPAGRNTAPAIAAGALRIREQFGDETTMLVLPSDHLIHDFAAFADAVLAAAGLAEQGYLVTFGIAPSGPETGFGYIEADQSRRLGGAGLSVRRFVEKPSREKAEEYLASGRYYWNSGMFCFRVGEFLGELARCAPEVSEAVAAAWQATPRDQVPIAIDQESFARIRDISIDYAVMENATRVAVVPGRFDWSDIGSWQALGELVPADADGNRVQGEAVLVDSSDCFVRSEDRLVAALGVQNLLVVDTPDALLIADRSRAQEVKSIVRRLNDGGHQSARLHRTVHRPWGTYTVLEEGTRFKIKRIVVKPGASLSLQYHHRRSEHWVVVSGSAKIVNGEHEIILGADQSSYIPAGTAHRLANPGKVDCVMIEVQSGDYLGEDDIIRVEDNYGRK
ncbi:MAG: mannose-1-phosphate guanylyltransferase/mannose-6-phosphate isomerase [Betaproteobacteria bacterium]|nr:mannose-1-phosphate guanylyltransferase/mannose-6-phosphate isomerase [Betaproteobacteria bacterium]